MENKYIIGIDGGSQSMKLTIFDLRGNAVCEARHPLRACVSVKPGYSEHPDDDLWDAFLAACTKLAAVFEGSMQDVIGIGLCTIRSCRVFLKEDGSLAQPVMSWLDSRAFGPVDASPDVRYVTTTTGYFTHRLTGNFADTVANNSAGQWPVDLYTWDWSDDPQKYIDYHISRNMLVPLVVPGTILGTLRDDVAKATGLPAGVPVVATANDKSVEALGAGLVGGNAGLVSLGTYITSVVNGKEFLERGNDFFCNFSCIPNRYLHESNGIWRGMWTVSWLVDLLGDEVKLKADAAGMGVEDFLDGEAAVTPAGAEGLLTVLEWLNPDFLAHKKGMMIGFDVRHTRAHMYRSVIEGIAMTMKNKFTAMCKATGTPFPEKLILSGGGSSGSVFLKAFADVFGVPVVRNTVNNAAGLGSAVCAAVAVGAYPGFDEAVAAMVKVRDVTPPNEANHRLYTQINEDVYSKLSPTMDGLLLRLREIITG